jgi:hypothetical protein
MSNTGVKHVYLDKGARKKRYNVLADREGKLRGYGRYATLEEATAVARTIPPARNARVREADTGKFTEGEPG